MSERNAIPWNANWQEHIACVFEDVLSQRGRFVRDDAVIDVVGVAEGGLGAVQYLGSCCMCPLLLPCLLSPCVCWCMMLMVNRAVLVPPCHIPRPH